MREHAFPNPALADENFSPPWDMDGLTKLEYFAAHAPISLADAIAACDFRAAVDWNSDAVRQAVFSVLSLLRFEYARQMCCQSGSEAEADAVREALQEAFSTKPVKSAPENQPPAEGGNVSGNEGDET